MKTLSHARPPVQPTAAGPAGPELPPEADEPYTPSPEDLAYDTGYTIGLEDGRYRVPAHWTGAMSLRYANGWHEGRLRREAGAARQLGETLGHAAGPPGPPSGLGPHEAAAFRAGFAEGLARFEAERAEDAHIDELALEAQGREYGFTDLDAWPAGCVS